MVIEGLTSASGASNLNDFAATLPAMEQNSLENRKRSWLSEMSSSAGRSSRQTNKDTRASIFVVAMIISLKRSPIPWPANAPPHDPTRIFEMA